MFRVQTIQLDLPAVAGAFSQRLGAGGLPVTPERTAAFASALVLSRPVTRRRLYWTARAVFVTDHTQVKGFDAVFRAVFGPEGAADRPEAGDEQEVRTAPAPADERAAEEQASGSLHTEPPPLPTSTPPTSDDAPAGPESPEVPVPMAPSDEEVLRHKRFDALAPHELSQLYELMTRLTLATPRRRTRRATHHRHGKRIDLRRTLRAGLRTGGDASRLMRRRRRVLPRRMVLLCDISGSMEPYARAYLQFLTCAAGAGVAGGGSEAFVFATRLTRVTRALASRSPERAIQRAAAAAPDWSSGTRIGDALKAFNDQHGRRGMARGAVIVILSDGWERGDPGLVGQEMERLARLAHRIVWVNPRAGAEGFAPQAAGMAAALPFLDALVSGDSLAALGDVVDAIAGEGPAPPSAASVPEEDDEPWASATPVAGSSVAMPSGYGPKRGHTTPGWGS